MRQLHPSNQATNTPYVRLVEPSVQPHDWQIIKKQDNSGEPYSMCVFSTIGFKVFMFTSAFQNTVGRQEVGVVL